MSSILITGVNRGIGLELARCFAEDDWQVFACCRSPEQADELQALAAKTDNLSIHRLEVTDRAQIAENSSGDHYAYRTSKAADKRTVSRPRGSRHHYCRPAPRLGAHPHGRNRCAT